MFLLFWLALSGLAFVSCKKNTDPASPTPPVITVLNPVVSGTVNTNTILEASATGGQGALTYAWVIKASPTDSKATLRNANTLKAELTPDKPGTYSIGLTVTDANGQKAATEITLTASLPGKAPVISVVTSMTVETGKQTSIDGSKSSDPDGDKLTYAWTIKTKPTGSTAVLTNTEGAIAGFTADIAGIYSLSLSISDGIWPAVSQEVSVTATAPAVRVVNGSWTTADGTSGGIDYSPRNKFYSFEVATNNQPISLTLTSSDVNVGVSLYDPLGSRLVNRGTGRSVVVDQTVNAGTYSVMVSTVQRYDVGAFRLAGRGIASEFIPKPADRVQAANVSFGSEGGGGGIGNRLPISPRNQYYTFDVTEDNTITDINVAPTGISIWLNLRSPAGAEADYTFGLLPVGSPRYFAKSLNKGTYGLYVGTGTRDAIGTYTLEIFGKVKNLKQTVFDSAIQTDSYIGKNGVITYTLTVTEDNTPLDISLRSPDIVGTAALINPNGTTMDKFTVPTNYDYMLNVVNKGVYKITITPGSATSGIGKYTLSVYGKFSDLKKQ
ncbi:hypothetical protein GO730_01015 [Spirosoma sp. HMF3257]|uniref:Uncharacterized protein n=2 Tax=Spirosoma telluris TaxID=2183553 RepID=A0A327NWP8_9BACT|nr:hypothetical protein [Spirosoma telluris]RAI78304.1 hypothetical protein HMF3257_00990 [Spirosoma telluris]